MAAPYRCTVTIDGTKFDAVSTSVTFGTEKDKAGMPQMGSLTTEIRVWADFHDDTNIPFSAVSKFFTLANVVTRDKIKGWVSRFETSNGNEFTRGMNLGGEEDDKDFQGLVPELNHLLVLDLEPVLNQENFAEVKMSN